MYAWVCICEWEEGSLCERALSQDKLCLYYDMNASRDMYGVHEWVISRMSMRQVIYMNEAPGPMHQGGGIE